MCVCVCVCERRREKHTCVHAHAHVGVWVGVQVCNYIRGCKPMASLQFSALSVFDLYSCPAVLGLLQSQSPCSVTAYGLWGLACGFCTSELFPLCVCVPVCATVCVCACTYREISLSNASCCSLLVSCVSCTCVMDRWKRVR